MLVVVFASAVAAGALAGAPVQRLRALLGGRTR